MYLFTSSSVTQGASLGIGAVMGGTAQFNHTDVIVTGPAGATSVDMTFSMIVNASFVGGYARQWDARVTIGSHGSAANANLDEPGRLISVTEQIPLDGGSPVSRSRPQTISASVGHQVFVNPSGTASGISRFRAPNACDGEIFTFSLPGCSASSVSAGIVDNRVAPDPDCCPADFNGTRVPTVQDIFDFLAAYFGNNLSADINRIGNLSVQDIFDFLATYFAGCP